MTGDRFKPVVGTRRLTIYQVFYNLFAKKTYRVRGRCNICGRPIFSVTRKFAKKGLCLCCAAAYEDGLRDRLVQAFNPKLKKWSLIDTVAGGIIAISSGEAPFLDVRKAEQERGADVTG